MMNTTFTGPDGLEIKAVTDTRRESYYLISRPDPDHPGFRHGQRADTVAEIEALGIDLASLEVAA